MFSRTYRVVVAPKLIVTTLLAGKVYPVDATIVVKLELSVEPCTDSVSVREPQPLGRRLLAGGGSDDVSGRHQVGIHGREGHAREYRAVALASLHCNVTDRMHRGHGSRG